MEIKKWLPVCLATLTFPLCAAGAPSPVNNEKGNLISLSLEELSNLEVTSVSKAPQKLLQAPAAIFVITQDDIRRSGATSIPEALRLAPGVDVARINSNQWSIGVRGFGDRLARSVLVLIDGRAVYAPLFAGTYWEVQDYPLEDIDRIEVIRGPGGSLWGANAFNGVINIITKTAKDTQGALLTAGGGTEERGFGGLRYGGKSGDNFNYRVYGKYFDRDSSFHANNDNFDAWQMGQGGFRTDWNMGKRDRLTLQGDLYKGQTGEELAVGTYARPFSQTLTQNADLFGANLLGRWKRELNATSDLSLQWYYDRTNRTDLNFTELRDTLDLDFQHRLGWTWHQELTWGMEYRLTANRITSLPTVVFDPADRTDHLATAFIQDQVPLVQDVLQLTFGTKVEHNDFSGWEEEPSGRLAWTPTQKQTVWTAVSRAVAMPSQVDQDLTVTLPGVGIPGFPVGIFPRLVANKDFESEKLTAYELGYRLQPVEPFFMDLAGFYNRYDNLLTGEVGALSLQTTPSPALIIPVVLGNKMSGETHGVEWASTWNVLSWWRWRADYSLLLIHMRLDPDSTDTTGRPAATAGSSPRHQASLQWSMDLPGHFGLDPTLRYTDVLSSLGIPPYWEGDVRLGWHATPHLEVALVGQNLLQSHHPEADTTQQLQRGFYGQTTWKW
jgi:iron complex outermembrane recepter protein